MCGGTKPLPPNDFHTDKLRAVVRAAIEEHMPADELAAVKRIEELERQTILAIDFGEAA
jgi:hypothetical protein